MNDPSEIAKTTGVLYIPELTKIDKGFRKKLRQFTKHYDLTGLILPNVTVITSNITLKKYSTSKVSNRLYRKVSHLTQFKINPISI